jgi:hypothetical protein
MAVVLAQIIRHLVPLHGIGLADVTNEEMFERSATGERWPWHILTLGRNANIAAPRERQWTSKTKAIDRARELLLPSPGFCIHFDPGYVDLD